MTLCVRVVHGSDHSLTNVQVELWVLFPSHTKFCLRHKLLQQEIVLSAVRGIRKLVIMVHRFVFSAIQCYEAFSYVFTRVRNSSEVRAADVSLLLSCLLMTPRIARLPERASKPCFHASPHSLRRRLSVTARGPAWGTAQIALPKPHVCRLLNSPFRRLSKYSGNECDQFKVIQHPHSSSKWSKISLS